MWHDCKTVTTTLPRGDGVIARNIHASMYTYENQRRTNNISQIKKLQHSSATRRGSAKTIFFYHRSLVDVQQANGLFLTPFITVVSTFKVSRSIRVIAQDVVSNRSEWPQHDMERGAYLHRLARTCRCARRHTLSSHRSFTSGRSKGDAKKAGTARVPPSDVSSVLYIGVEGGNDGVNSEVSDAV